MENILNRKFSADIPQHKVLTDITEFKYGNNKKIYMCVILDLYDRSILSYSLSKKADTKLVLEVLQNRFNKRVGHKRILHTDRGSPFTSLEYRKSLENLGIIHSMSRVGKLLIMGQWKSSLEI